MMKHTHTCTHVCTDHKTPSARIAHTLATRRQPRCETGTQTHTHTHSARRCTCAGSRTLREVITAANNPQHVCNRVTSRRHRCRRRRAAVARVCLCVCECVTASTRRLRGLAEYVCWHKIVEKQIAHNLSVFGVSSSSSPSSPSSHWMICTQAPPHRNAERALSR